MRKHVFGFLLGLAGVVGSLAIASPAKATYWRNFKSDVNNGLYLSINGLNQSGGDKLVIHSFTGLTNQTWTQPSNPNNSGTFYLLSGMHPPPPITNLVAGVQAGNMTAGTALIDWKQTSDLNQSWATMLWKTDSLGAQCFLVTNGDQSHGLFLMAVAGGVMTENRGVIIWPLTSAAGITDDQIWCKYKFDSTQNKLVPE